MIFDLNLDLTNDNYYHLTMNKQKYATNTFEPLTTEQSVMQRSRSFFPRLLSKDLFTSGNEVIIEHEGEEYHLRLTRQGKLILTK